MSQRPVPSASAGSDVRAFRIQMLVAFLTTTAIAGTRPTTTYRALDLGAGTFEVGLVQSAFSVLPALTAVAIGRWIDRHGEGRTYTSSLWAFSLGGVISALADNLPMLALGQAIVGFGTIGSLISGQAMITTRTRPDDWNRRFGTYAACLSLGQLVGPSAAAFIQGIPALGPDSERVVFLVGSISSLAAGLLTMVMPPGPRPSASATTDQAGFFSSIRRVVSRPGMLAAMFVSISVASTIDVLTAYLPIYGTVSLLSVQMVGLLLSVRAGATMVSRVGMDYLLSRLGWQRVLVACLAISAVMLALIPTTAFPPFLIGIMVVLGLAIGLVQPMTVTWIANRSTRAERGTALAVRLTGNRTSLLFVPAVMGAVAGSVGVAAVFWILAIALGAGATVSRTARLDRTREDAPARSPAAGSAPAPAATAATNAPAAPSGPAAGSAASHPGRGEGGG